MMHEFIECKKKAFRNNSIKNIKTSQHNKTFFDYSDEIQTESLLRLPLPPWLKNNLGFTQRINSKLDWNICLPNFVNLETSSFLSKNEEQTTQANKEFEAESVCMKADDHNMTSVNQTVFSEDEKLKNEEKQVFKLLRQKNKIKRRSFNANNTIESCKGGIDHIDLKTKEVIENSKQKEVASSNVEECEAKVLFFSNKCHDEEDQKFRQQETHLIERLKEEAAKSELEKFIKQVKQSSLKQFSGIYGDTEKSISQKIKGKDEKIIKKSFFNRSNVNEDKNSLISTDDEIDIKRFSEFLSKNKNQDEKRKCLEEVRNYFERKRRTRLTKRRLEDDFKTPITNTFQIYRKEQQAKEKLKTKEVCTLLSGRNKKSKSGFYNEEVVEKAVYETLQKFVNLYHFHVSPTVMNSMKRNILKAIQSDSLNSDGSKLNLARDKGLDESKLEKGFAVRENNIRMNDESKEHQMCAFNNIDCIGEELKKKNFKTTKNPPEDHSSKPSRKFDFMENENTKRLKKEFENFLNSIQVQADVCGVKLHSVILEKEQSSSKTIQFVHNFTKKVLESNNMNGISINWNLNDGQEGKSRKETETQTAFNLIACKKNVKSQTFEFKCFEKCLQTEEKIYASRDAQTEKLNLFVRELDVTSYDVSPGLYRMVKSKEAERFYLYPENLSYNSGQLYENFLSDEKIINNSGKKPKNKTAIVNFLMKRNTKKDKKAFPKHKKLGLSKRGYILASRESQKLLATDCCEAEKLKTCLSCLYFKNHQAFESPLKSKTNFYNNTLSESKPSYKQLKEKNRENHLGCVWFWNGEKITPGCDLKMHVEDLFKEKLKELTNIENYKFLSKEANNRDHSNSSKRNLNVKNTNAVFSFKRPLRSGNSSLLLSADCDSFQNKTGDKKTISKEKLNEEKFMQDASTQNSQQIFLSLNISSPKCRSKFSSLPKICKVKSRRKKLILKPIRGSQGYTLRQRRVGNSRKVLTSFKMFQSLNEIYVNSRENTSDSCSTKKFSASSSTFGDVSENSITFVQEANEVNEEENNASKIKKVISTVNYEVQMNNEDENSVENQTQNSEIQKYRQWELIESILNRASKKKQESFWNDIQNFLRMKIGKDINDDEAQEVCIEIEQDVPEMTQGKPNHVVLAIGHYKKNEGDVEVELVLTFEDLEKILKSRKKKTQRKQSFFINKRQKNAFNSST